MDDWTERKLEHWQSNRRADPTPAPGTDDVTMQSSLRIQVLRLSTLAARLQRVDMRHRANADVEEKADLNL